MTNMRRIEQLALLGRARVLWSDGDQVMLALYPPLDRNPAWPSNVVALRRISYSTARTMRGLAQR